MKKKGFSRQLTVWFPGQNNVVDLKVFKKSLNSFYEGFRLQMSINDANMNRNFFGDYIRAARAGSSESDLQGTEGT